MYILVFEFWYLEIICDLFFIDCHFQLVQVRILKFSKIGFILNKDNWNS